jgi:hypothetical protein
VENNAPFLSTKVSIETKQRYANFLASIYGRSSADEAKFTPAEVQKAIEDRLTQDLK